MFLELSIGWIKIYPKSPSPPPTSNDRYNIAINVVNIFVIFMKNVKYRFCNMFVLPENANNQIYPMKSDFIGILEQKPR